MKENELCNLWTETLGECEQQEPAQYEVILHNDDFTPMAFVLTVLENVFFMDEQRAKTIMLKAHREGRAIIGWFTQDVAATKINDAITRARKEEHPLMCSMEVAT